MAHFAELNDNNYVLRIVCVGDDVPTSNGPLGENDMHVDGEAWCKKFFKGGKWKQVSHSNKFRNMYPGPGSFYDENTNEFYPPKEHASWVLSENKKCWVAPIAEPIPPVTPDEFNPVYAWDEGRQTWIGTIDNGATRNTWDPVNLVWIPLS
jgi:hypothetical protein